MPWRWLFVLLLGAGGAYVWRNEEARAELWRELGLATGFINRLGGACEPWQVSAREGARGERGREVEGGREGGGHDWCIYAGLVCA